MTLDNLCTSIDNFFLCTHIPMKAVKIDGEVIHSAGYDESLDSLFSNNNIFQAAKNKLLCSGKNSYITINSLDGINFTAFNICSCNISDGFFILGPYKTNTKFFEVNIVYKPSSCIPHIVSLFHNIRNSAYFSESEKYLISSYSPYTERAIAYIKDNFHKAITLDDISNHIKINRCYFCNVFKKETGKTYSQFLNDIRIEKSKELLMDRALSILEVSLSAGFNNQNYFNTIFKKLTNMTPLEYRNNNTI
jgi:AraC-like DNA-binding protein